VRQKQKKVCGNLKQQLEVMASNPTFEKRFLFASFNYDIPLSLCGSAALLRAIVAFSDS
jgi:hypothetical protein